MASSSGLRLARFAWPLLAVSVLVIPATGAAQSEYYNTARGRPVRIEDAYAVDRYALDLHLSPLRVARGRGASNVALTPEVTYGLVPRTQVELSVPIRYRQNVPGGDRLRVAGVDVTALYNFNAETRTLPALGLRAGVLMPVGSGGPAVAHPSVTGLATRTFRWARLHANAHYTFGADTGGSAGMFTPPGDALTRWLAGIAADRAFAFHSLLATVEAFAASPLANESIVQWTVATGVRYQLAPVLTLDAGVGRRVSGPGQAWFLSAGISRTSSVRALSPGRGGWQR